MSKGELKMNIILKFATTELKPDKEMTHYNHLMYEATKPNVFNITHIKEVYDDVSSYPIYELGRIKDGRFRCLSIGDGEPVPENQFNCGGVFVEIDITRPDLFTEN